MARGSRGTDKHETIYIRCTMEQKKTWMHWLADNPKLEQAEALIKAVEKAKEPREIRG